MKCRSALVAALALAGVEAPAAMAIPLAPLADIAAASPMQEIGWRCGPGFHVNSWGRCAPNRRPPPVYGVPRRPVWRCAPGFHPNPWGRCVPNRW